MSSKLVGLRVENYKRIELVDVEFDPAGGVVAIMGANEAGKTSLLDALESLIAGRKMAKAAKPVHGDAKEARIIGTFDDLVVTRVYKPNGSTQIRVADADGRPFRDADEILKKLYSAIGLDPLAFSRLNDAEQVATLLPLIGFDPAPLDAEHDAAYADRRDAKRDLDKLKARLDAMPVDKEAPTAFVDVAALSDELSVALGSVSQKAQAESTVNARTYAVQSAHTTVENLRRALAAAEAEAVRFEDSLREAIAAADALSVIDAEPIRARMAEAESLNDRFRDASTRRALANEVSEAQARWDDLNSRVEIAKTQKMNALTAAADRMPVPGLSLDPESNVLTLNGIPFSQASTGVKIRTGTAVAMALNPEFRAIIIRDASLLDQGNREVIDELARENGFLVLMEIADENSPTGIVIEDGGVREVRS